jgi:hypothetical protein
VQVGEGAASVSEAPEVTHLGDTREGLRQIGRELLAVNSRVQQTIDV